MAQWPIGPNAIALNRIQREPWRRLDYLFPLPSSLSKTNNMLPHLVYFLFAAVSLMLAPRALWADALLYGKAHVSIDYVDASENSAWNRPAVGSPSFDMERFIEDANQALMDIGYIGVPGPGGINTAIADVLFGTYNGNFPFEDLDPVTQRRILTALRDAQEVGLPFKGWNMNANDRGSRLGVRGSERLGGGLSAIYQVELAIPLANSNDDIDDGDPGRLSMRNSFLGLTGGWGSVLVGRHDTPLKMSTGTLDLFADTLADYNATVGFDDVRADNSVLYMSPTWYGFQLSGALIPAGGATRVGARNPLADSFGDAWSVAASYAHGPFYASAAYEFFGTEMWRPQEGAYDTAHGLPPDDDKKWRIGLGLLDWRGISLTGVYESRSEILGMPVRASARMWQLQAAYAFGNSGVKAMYGQSNLDECADPWDVGFRYSCSVGIFGQVLGPELGGEIDQKDKSTWAIGFDHYFSRRTVAYALYTSVTDDNQAADWSGFSLGLAHNF